MGFVKFTQRVVARVRFTRTGALAAIVVAASLGLVAACGSDSSSDANVDAGDQVDQVDGRAGEPDGPGATVPVEPFAVIDIDQLNDQRQAMPQLQVVDARTLEEVATGTIPGSIHIPHDVIDGGNTEGLDLDAPIAIICRSGRRATIAGEALAQAGAVNINVVRPGGVGTWAEAGYPVIVP